LVEGRLVFTNPADRRQRAGCWLVSAQRQNGRGVTVAEVGAVEAAA
jgi:hypothetical protein